VVFPITPEGAAAAAAAAGVLGGFLRPIPLMPLAPPLAPVLSPAVAGAVATAVAAGVAAHLLDRWVRENSRPGGLFPPEFGPGAAPKGTYSPAGVTRWWGRATGESITGGTVNRTSSEVQTGGGGKVVIVEWVPEDEWWNGRKFYPWSATAAVVGSTGGTPNGNLGQWIPIGGLYVGARGWIQSESTEADATPHPLPVPSFPEWPVPLLDPPEPSSPEPERAPVPVPMPLRPSPVPSPLPAPSPRPATAPGRERGVPLPLRPPIPSPTPVKVPIPSPGPGREEEVDPQDEPEGQETPVPQTPVWQEVPWPGADPIGEPAKRPTPSLDGIATELGKIEQKVAQGFGRPIGPTLRDFETLLRSILGEEEPEYTYPAGSYQLHRVCEVDDDGNPLPPMSAPWPAGAGPMAELGAKIDAIAQLLQHHKVIKQPVCTPPRPPAPQGRPVTVTFEEI